MQVQYNNMSVMHSEAASSLHRRDEKAAWNNKALTSELWRHLHVFKEKANAMNVSVRDMLVIFAADMEVSAHNILSILT